jgi:osmotically-inducible protein OsmY
MVESDIDRDLAGELAEGIEGVTEVRNDLTVEPAQAQRRSANVERATRDDGRSFGTWVDDVTTTAAVKSALIANNNIKALQIDVSTHGDVVTLNGRVRSDEEKKLAEEIAKNTGDVAEVKSQLRIDPNL